MKKIYFTIVLALTLLPILAQNQLTINEGKTVFVYSLPKTAFCFEVEIEKVTQTPGIFYQYAQRYLATSDVITEEKTVYVLKNISLRTQTIADENRTYQMEVGNSANFLTLNRQGILCGVNVPLTEKKIIEKRIIKNEEINLPSGSLLPLGEEFMMAGSTAKLAEGAAKQIYRIRESRMMLLGGDMENQPSDGKALTTMLEGLNKTENQLTSLFVGNTKVETQTQIVRIVPEAAIQNKVLFRISSLRGLVDVNDLGGAPYYINFFTNEIKTQPRDPKVKPENPAIFTILPADTKIQITDGVKVLLEKELQIPQFGVVIPVSEKIFNIRNLKISIDSETGRIFSIEK